MPVETVADADALEACVGARPASFHLKSIDHLDEHCHALLGASPFAVIGALAGDGSLRTTAVGGAAGVVAVSGRAELTLPSLAALDLPGAASISLLSFVPGYRETLRVNGRLRTGTAAVVDVEEAFLHCAKAVIRSGLWKAPAPPALTVDNGIQALADPGVAAFFEACPFVAISSCDGGGEADVSPKGDPPGIVARVLDEHTIVVADRPGNGRTDTMHNLVTRDSVGLLALVPGLDQVIEVRGRAGVTGDETVRESLAVNGKTPKAAIAITVEHLEVRHEPAIDAAGLWDTARHVDPATLPKSTRIWVDHVQRNTDPGDAARAARGMLTVPMLEVGITNDYRDNLY